MRKQHKAIRGVLLLSISILLTALLSGCRPERTGPRRIWSQTGETGLTYELGYAVASAGDVNGDGFDDLIVGAPKYSGSGSNYVYGQGLVQVYYGSEDYLSDTPDWTASGERYSYFGSSVGTAGDVNGDGYDDVIIGAPSELNPNRPSPSAYVYYGSPTGLDLNGTRPVGSASNANWSGSQSTDQFGYSDYGVTVSTAGDVNGDDFADVIIGAPGLTYPSDVEGWAYVYHGSATGLSPNPDWSFEFFAQEDALFGTSVSSAGDVNGDGFSDVIIGAPGFDEKAHFPFTEDVGAVFVFYGSTTGLSASPDWEYWAFEENLMFGSSVSTAGDVNGDGYSDVIAGYPYWSQQPQYGTGDGLAYVFHGSASGLGNSPDWQTYLCDPAAPGRIHFGWSVSSAGTDNGDEFSDVIIGAPFNHTPNEAGQFCVFRGTANGLPADPYNTPDSYWSVEGQTEDARLGWVVASAGDLNNDGCSEVVVGAPNHSVNPAYKEGMVSVYAFVPCSIPVGTP